MNKLTLWIELNVCMKPDDFHEWIVLKKWWLGEMHIAHSKNFLGRSLFIPFSSKERWRRKRFVLQGVPLLLDLSG